MEDLAVNDVTLAAATKKIQFNLTSQRGLEAEITSVERDLTIEKAKLDKTFRRHKRAINNLNNFQASKTAEFQKERKGLVESFNALELKQSTVKGKTDSKKDSTFSELSLLKSECDAQVEQARKRLLQHERAHSKQVAELLRNLEASEQKVLQQAFVVRNLLIRKHLANAAYSGTST